VVGLSVFRAVRDDHFRREQQRRDRRRVLQGNPLDLVDSMIPATIMST
jgi:hypothetical protein